MARIFLSHTRHFDTELLDQITGRLSGDHSLNGTLSVDLGEDWEETLKSRLSQSEIAVFLIDETSLDSEEFETEVNFAMGYSKATSDLAILPVVFGEIKIPRYLNRLNSLRIDLTNLELGLDGIVSSINRILGKQAAEFEIRDEQRTQIKIEAAEFVAESLKTLEKKEATERIISFSWYALSGLALLAGVGFSFYRLTYFDFENSSIFSTIEVAIASTIGVGLTLAFSRLSFTLGKAHMVEALRNADRKHAISYGEFYLNAKGKDIDWSELKEAFQHWNIDKGSAFSLQNSDDFDPKLLERALELAKVLSNNSK